jgi:hypothetical protein
MSTAYRVPMLPSPGPGISFFKPGTTRECVVCKLPIENPTKTQLAHTLGPCAGVLLDLRQRKNREKQKAKREKAKLSQ